jgi:hypothetical protein
MSCQLRECTLTDEDGYFLDKYRAGGHLTIVSMLKMMTGQSTRLPIFLAAFGVLLLIATIFHQINGVPESWRTTFTSTNAVQTQTQTRCIASANGLLVLLLTRRQ